MMYGNSSNGYGYSPDRSRDVDHYNRHYTNNLQYGNGNSSYGYYGSTSTYHQSGKGEWKQSGSGAWYKE